MRRITFALMSTIAAVVLLFSYRTSTGHSATPATAAAATGAQTPGIVSGAAPDPSPSPAAADPSPSAASPGTGKVVVNGSVAQTRWGPVQVQVTIAGGKVTDVTAVEYPQDNPRDQEINSYAIPALHDQAIQAQSAQLDGVSGATVTSDGYRESLQAALDAAHFG